MAPNFDTLLALGKELEPKDFSCSRSIGTPTKFATESRMFCPALGIPEDPVSGNAHAMLAAYLWELDNSTRK